MTAIFRRNENKLVSFVWQCEKIDMLHLLVALVTVGVFQGSKELIV